MLIKSRSELRDNDVTDPEVYRGRRRWLKSMAALGMLGWNMKASAEGLSLSAFKPGVITLDDALTEKEHATHYNNFYELGVGKTDPSRHASALRTTPWTVAVEGEIARPGQYAIEDLLKAFPLEERIYRLRCVEAWSMVIPWIGFPLASLIRQVEPNSRAKYVEFTSVYDPEAPLPGQYEETISWPYVEGLRMDEAMHPLTLMAVGMYGDVLPGQNGAPLRLVVPWKYGFKSAKSIVRIRFVESMPRTSWNRIAPHEYGFYSNVNPRVDHPRWSQSRERRIGEWGKRETLMFNGYADQVAHLYKGMDLNKWF